MANTHKLINSTTVGVAGASTIDITSIPSTYRDLRLVLSLRSTRATYSNDDFYVNVNGSTSQTVKYFQSSGSGSVGSFLGGTGRWGGLVPADGATTASIFGNAELYIPNYKDTSYYKVMFLQSVNENNATESYNILQGGKWVSTSAINQLTIVCAAGSFKQYSTATLYGII